MKEKKQKTIFVHAGTGCVIKQNGYVVNQMFFNNMYLLGDKLFDASNRVVVEKPLSIENENDFLVVLSKKWHYLFDNKGKMLAKSLKKIDVFFNGWYAFFDKNDVRKLVNNKNEVIVENFSEVTFYANGWYVVKFNDEMSLYDESGKNIYSSNYGIVVDDEHDRFIVCYSEDKLSVFEKDLKPVVLNIDAFVSIENIYAIKQGNMVEIFSHSSNDENDKSVWKGTKDEFLSDVCIMDINNDADVLVEKLLKSK